MTLRFVDRDGGPSVLLQSSALTVIDRYRQRRLWQREAGGQLFARFEGAHTLVEVATAPSRRDLRSRFGFRPHQPTQKAEIRSFYERGLHFVGDWHSHPETLPEPSFTDLASVRECFQQSRHDLKALLLVVAGRRAGSAGLWVGLVTRQTVRRLNPEQTIHAPIHKNSASDTTNETAP
jgi:integrative and conjugative element protein (TIGR02256 family)